MFRSWWLFLNSGTKYLQPNCTNKPLKNTVLVLMNLILGFACYLDVVSRYLCLGTALVIANFKTPLLCVKMNLLNMSPCNLSDKPHVDL